MIPARISAYVSALHVFVERMEVADHLVEARGVQVGVDLGGLDTGMPQKLLQYSQIGAARVHVGGECVAQNVR
jgi:hypothetical protein